MTNYASLIRAYARRYGVDPRAALAVASQEGLGGGVGDSGTSFGPFQLHRGGALPAGKGRSWAESPAGIDYAMREIASVSHGLRGRAAIQAIVTRFERPANPAKEIAGAEAAYGRVNGRSGDVTQMANDTSHGAYGPSQDAQDARTGVLDALIAGRDPTSALLNMAKVARTQPQGHWRDANVLRPYEPDYQMSQKGSTLSQLEPLAKQFGLSITSTTGGHHVPNSWHYKGRAVDFSGNASHMAKLMQYALQHPGQFKEAFYDPAGYYVKNGKVYKGRIGGHTDHVHLAR